MAESEIITPTPFKVRSMRLSLPLHVPSVTECKEWMAQNSTNPHIPELLKIAESGEPRFMPLSMTAFAIGDQLCILSLSHEIFAEYQLFADETSPFAHTFVFGYTNGTACYVATKRDYLLRLSGGYEASPLLQAGSAYRLSLQPSVEKLIRNGITSLFHQLKSE